MTPEQALDVIRAVSTAGAKLAAATGNQMGLARFLSVRKDEAIRRIMAGKNLSGTAAEKLAEQDPEFADHCRAAIDAEVLRLEADAAYRAAQYRAQLALTLLEKAGVE